MTVQVKLTSVCRCYNIKQGKSWSSSNQIKVKLNPFLPLLKDYLVIPRFYSRFLYLYCPRSKYQCHNWPLCSTKVPGNNTIFSYCNCEHLYDLHFFEQTVMRQSVGVMKLLPSNYTLYVMQMGNCRAACMYYAP